LLIKLAADGTVQWTRSYGGTDNDGSYNVASTHDGGFIIQGETSSFSLPIDFYILKVDSTGILMWSRAFGDSMVETRCGGIMQTPDKGYAFAGNSDTFNGYVYLVKTDSAGVSSCYMNSPATISGSPSITISNPATIVNTFVPNAWPLVTSSTHRFIVTDLCGSVNVSKTDLDMRFELVPNPATDYLTITSKMFGENATLEIFNSLGEKICWAVYSEPTTVNCEHFPRGIYFVRLSNSEKQFTKKLVIN
jgi:hypothetical protein